MSRMGLRRTLPLEMAKLRRMRVAPVVAAIVLPGIGLSTMRLFSSSTTASWTAPGVDPWPALMVSAAMMSAITHQILTAVLASRQVEIEHAGAGWNLWSTVGLAPGALLRVKLAALAPIIVLSCLAQVGAVLVVARLRGIEAPLDPMPWAVLTAGLICVDLAMCAGLLLLAARFANQLLTVGAGLIGAFASACLFPAPQWVARALPWGYYAVATPARMTSAGGVGAHGSGPWLVGFMVLAGAVFAVATRRMDRGEGRVG